MRRTWLLFLAGLSLARADGPAATNAAPGTAAAPAAVDTVTVRPIPARSGMLRNPAMGWVLYSEPAFKGGGLPDPAKYWAQADPYVPYTSILYLRCTWSQLEPQEGHYAWNESDRFRGLIQGALDRHLHLAFRVVVNSIDCHEPATPLWVQAAGAAGADVSGAGGRKLWSPQVDDPVFRRKLEKFVAAFGQAFDDPSRVDYVDGGGLGTWGELHHVETADPKATLEWICGTYAAAFHHVLLGWQVGSPLANGGKDDPEVFGKYGYVARIDSLGSHWLGDRKIAELQALYPRVPFYGESCYFALDSMRTWQNDRKRRLTSPRDVLQATYDDAMACHANTLDLRAPSDAAIALRDAPDIVAAFLSNAGYRLYPEAVEYPKEISAGQPATIRHAWKNLGSGILPNDNLRWGRKFHVAFALIDPANKQPIATAVDPDADPGQWTTGLDVANTARVTFTPPPPPGDYQLGVALVNTQDNDTPGIQLATLELPRFGGWVLLGGIHVNPAPSTGN